MPEDIQKTLDERGARYGDFTDHAAIAQALQDVVRRVEQGWARLSPVQRQALTVICDKIARIMNGDPDYDDNWRDIIGYAQLVLDRLPVKAVATGLNLGYEPVDEEDAARWIDRIREEMPNDTIADNRVRQLRADFGLLEPVNSAPTAKEVQDDIMRRTHVANGYGPEGPAKDEERSDVKYRAHRMIEYGQAVLAQSIALAAAFGDDLDGLRTFTIEVSPEHANVSEGVTLEDFTQERDRALRAESQLVAANMKIDRLNVEFEDFAKDSDYKRDQLEKEVAYLRAHNDAWAKRFAELAALTPPKAPIVTGIDLAGGPDQTSIALMRDGKIEHVATANGHTIQSMDDAEAARRKREEEWTVAQAHQAHEEGYRAGSSGAGKDQVRASGRFAEEYEAGYQLGASDRVAAID